MPGPPELTAIARKAGSALVAAAVFHLVVTFGIFCVGRLALAPRQFDRDGIGEFARDSRDHQLAAERLVSMLKQGDLKAWVNSNDPLHVKLYSLSVLVVGPLAGNNIVAVEPVNLFCYLAMLVLTFMAARVVSGAGGGWLAAFIVAVWPSLLLHTTQFLRDPFVIVGVLGLITVLLVILKQRLTWLTAIGIVTAGTAAIYLVFHTRPEIWLLITAIVLVSNLLLLIKIAATRQLLAANLLAIVVLAIVSLAMPRPAAGVVSMPLNRPLPVPFSSVSRANPMFMRIAYARMKFIVESQNVSGSLIDQDVLFNSWGDVIRYIPRALEIGYLAPFPSMWFRTGHNVGLIGRIISGIEMLLTYLFEIFAILFVWRNRRHSGTWLLVIATMLGMLALGLVVANLGTLYRMRYPFWILLVIMGAASLIEIQRSRMSRAKPEAMVNASAV
jgi:hypothetical protein